MSSDTSNSGIMQKADQIAFHFYTKLFYTINQARATEEPHSQGKIDKWFNLETPDSDLFTREAREPYRNISLSPPPGPPPLEIQVLLCIPELTNNQVLIHRSDDSSNTIDLSTQQPSSPTSDRSPSSARSQLRIEPTPRSIVLETWTLTFVPHASSNRLSDQALPTIYKHGIPLFRSLYSLLRVLPVWKLYKRLKRRTGGVNRNGHLGISLRVKPLEESDEALDILAFDVPPSPSHPPLQTQTHTFSPLPHPLGSLTLSATYLSNPNFELDELESHLSNRFISLDLQGFVPTLSKQAVREEREDGSTGGGGVGPGVGSARSPPRAIVGSTGGRRGEHGHSHGLGLLGTGPNSAPGFGESTSSMNSIGRPVANITSTKTSDNTTVAERFIIPSPLNLAVTSPPSSSALIPPPRPQFTPLPVPLPFPTVGGATSSPSSGASGLALHRMRRESSNSSSSAAAVTGPGTGRASPEIFSSSISPHRTSYSHSPHPYPYPSSLSSSPGAVPIRRNTATSGISINPFKGNTLSSTTSASVSASGSSPSLSIRQGLSSAGVVSGGGGSPLSTSFSSRIQQPSSVGSSTRVGFPLPPPSPYGPSTPSSLGDRGGDWDREERERRASNDGSSRERDRFRRISMGGQEDAIGTGGGVGVPTRIPATRKRYSSSFGNRYVGSVGSVGGGGGGGGVGSGESGRSTPASVSASTGAAGGVGGLEGGGDGKGKEQNAAGGIISSFLSTTTDDDDISIFVQHIDARKPLSGRVKEGEKRERDREREMDRGRDRDREENEPDHDREMRQESGRGKGQVREASELVTSPGYRPRQRSPLSPLSQRERILSPMTGTALPALGTTERMTAESAVPAVSTASGSTTATTPETTIQSPMLSPSPPAPSRLSTSPNRGPMLTNQDDVDEKLKRMNETFMRSLEGMGKGSVRRKDKEKGKEKEVERDAATRRGLFLVSPSEGEVPADPSGGSGGPLMHTSASPYPGQQQQQHPNHPTRIPSPTSSDGSSPNQPCIFYPQTTSLALELGRGRGVVRSTSTSTSTSASSEAVGGASASASQGLEEVIGRMDFYGESGGGPRRF